LLHPCRLFFKHALNAFTDCEIERIREKEIERVSCLRHPALSTMLNPIPSASSIPATLTTICLLIALIHPQVFGGPNQEPEKPAPSPAAEEPAPAEHEHPVIRNARKLHEKGKLPAVETLQGWLQHPTPESIVLQTASTAPLPPREIAKRASAAYVRVGWVFQCNKCSRWHANLSGGYAIAPNAIATARHVLNPPENIKPGSGFLIAVSMAEEVLVPSGILGADQASDAAILKVEAHDLQPLPLNADIEVGDTVFCLSEPFGQSPYFSSGIVNRFADQSINVSTDWAPGSSGSAVLDAHGNAIGHVGKITSLADTKNKDKQDHYMCVHWAIPAKKVLQLAKPESGKK
jgi:hypothetical protein